MSTAATESPPPGPVISLENLLFDFPEADVILRSRDSYEFRVLKLYIVHSSPILGDKVLLSPNTQPEQSASAKPSESNVEHTEADALGVVQLPIEGAILFSLLTFIFPVPPVLPSTVEQTMELLSVAQMYKMDVVLAHVRIHIAQHQPSFIREETAFHVYSLAQKYGLRTEALQAARCTLSFSSLTIEDLAKEQKLDVMPGTVLHELWKYHRRVRSNLTSDLEEFKKSNAFAILGDLSCKPLGLFGPPHWLYSYISSIGTGRVPAFLDFTEFHIGLTKHITTWESRSRKTLGGCASCSDITQKQMREFWEVLTATVHSSMAKADPGFAIPVEGTRSEDQGGPTREASSPPKYSDMPNADIILQSSDLVQFRVHKSALVASSPFFGDMFSLPQPPNDTEPDGLPVVHLSEDAEVLNSLISLLYSVAPEMPPTSDNILALLAAATKYDMDAAQSSIRAGVSRRGLLSSTGTGVFRVYAVACSKGLVPEIEAAARLTLGYPLTFESLGDGLRLFEGRALHDLADFRLRSIHNLSSNWESFLDCLEGPSKIWVDCPTVTPTVAEIGGNEDRCLPTWLRDCLLLESNSGIWSFSFEYRPGGKFSHVIPTSVQLCDKYLKALQSHVKAKDCNFCMKVHILEGENFCARMKDILAQAWNVPIIVPGERPGTP